MRDHLRLAPLLLLAWPLAATALPLPVGFTMEGAVSAGPGGATPRLTAAASCWLDGDLEAEARLGLGSARRPDGRGAVAVVPGLGLRWAPDLGRWRPLLGLEAGVALPVAGLRTSPTGSARAGVELLVRRRVGLSLAAGWRWSAQARSGAEAILGIALAP